MALSSPLPDGSPGTSAGAEAPTLQSRLERPRHRAARPAGPVGPRPAVTDPVGLLEHLEESRRFHRDSGFGRVFHPGRVSFRENVATNSLHVVVDENRISAHVDRVSPLGVKGEAPSRYSVRRAVMHNLVGMGQDLVRLLRGRQGDHRCELNCEWMASLADAAPDDGDLLDPETSAWSLQLEARVAGVVDEGRLRDAVSAVLGGGRSGRARLHVVECPDDLALDAARTRLQSRVVRVAERPPARVLLARHPGGDVLMLNLNHAAADGLAALRVLRSVALAYAGQAVAPVDFLAGRELPVRPASAPVPAVVRTHRKVVERLRDLLTRPARLIPEQPVDRPGHGFHLVRLSAPDTLRVLGVKGTGRSKNVLLAALHLAIGDWNLRHAAPGRRIGVLTPVDLRPDERRDDTIGNFSVTARVSTSRRHRRGPASALEAVTAQTTRNRRTRTGTALIAALERAGLLALWAKQSLVVLQPLTGNHFVDTAMLAHLGRLDEAPWFGPELGHATEVWFSTPARSPNSLCVGAVVVDGRLHLTFRYPQRLFGPEAAARFAACYTDHLGQMAEARPSGEGAGAPGERTGMTAS